MALQIFQEKGKEKEIAFSQFLSGRAARDYVFQDTPYKEQIQKAARLIENAEAIVIGAGAGLSTAAGLNYGGSRFAEHFGQFIEKYGSANMTDMYSAGFYIFPSEEAKWGYWSKHVLVNRIEPEGLPLYQAVYKLVKEKPYFVLTTNVDHQFWKAGFENDRIFATQGDYGEIQCARGCHQKVYDGTDLFLRMDQARKDCEIPSSMVPKCPVCGGNMAMHLRSDQYFVEDAHWKEAAANYGEFLRSQKGKRVVLLELGVGFNTPVIIRFPFEQMAGEERNWSLIRLNLNEAVIPESLGDRGIGIGADIGESIRDLCQAVGQNQEEV